MVVLLFSSCIIPSPVFSFRAPAYIAPEDFNCGECASARREDVGMRRHCVQWPVSIYPLLLTLTEGSKQQGKADPSSEKRESTMKTKFSPKHVQIAAACGLALSVLS